MGAGAYIEPLIVVVLLFGGAWVNRTSDFSLATRKSPWHRHDRVSKKQEGLSVHAVAGKVDKTFTEQPLKDRSRSLSSSLLPSQKDTWRKRNFRFLGMRKQIASPDTAVFQNRLLSRVLRKFPFLVECWYWALVYWTYQLGRAFTAVTLQQGTVHVARKHAMQLIEIEKRLHIFWEVLIQQMFLKNHTLMTWTNWLYSFIHIPGTIAFLVWLYYYTITRNRLSGRQLGQHQGLDLGSSTGPQLYEARRRTMAVCNLLAFIVFTFWPCMPPRLLSDTSITGATGDIARSYGFVDTVHGKAGAGSVWTENRFCNQYAAMPSLHFGYSLMIGLTIMTIPLTPHHRRSRSTILPFFKRSHPKLAPHIHLPSWRRVACLLAGFCYPFSILVAIVATANHFILDAVAGAVICGLGWWGNSVLLNLLPLEDYFLWALRMHKPVQIATDQSEVDTDDEEEVVTGVIID